MLNCYRVTVKVIDRCTQIVIKETSTYTSARNSAIAKRIAIDYERDNAHKWLMRRMAEKYEVAPSVLERMIEDGNIIIPERVDIMATAKIADTSKFEEFTDYDY